MLKIVQRLMANNTAKLLVWADGERSAVPIMITLHFSRKMRDKMIECVRHINMRRYTHSYIHKTHV